MRQIANYGDIYVLSALNRDDGFLGCLTFRLEVDQSINAGIGALLAPTKRNGVNP